MSRLCLVSLFLLFLVFVSTAYAAPEALTFNAFYSQGISIWFWITGIGFALAAIGAVILSGGTAGPIMTAAGGWIGGMFGLSGVAATNFGLALLGGGSLAAGGFGMAGGVVVLTALFEFAALGGGYVVEKITISFDEAQFIEQSKKLVVLPIPLKTSGSPIYEQSIKNLGKQYKKDELHSSESNLRALSEAIAILEKSDIGPSKDLQSSTLLALLYHQRSKEDDCRKCRELSDKVIRTARNGGMDEKNLTFPLALKAICSLGVADAKSTKIVEEFVQASVLESKKEMVVLAAAVFADRMMMRDDLVNGADFARLVKSAGYVPGEKLTDAYALVFLMRYNLKLNEYWSAIKFFGDNLGNDDILMKPKNLQNCEFVYHKYEDLLTKTPEMTMAVAMLKPERVGGSKELPEGKKLIADLQDSFAKHSENRAVAKKCFTDYRSAYYKQKGSSWPLIVLVAIGLIIILGAVMYWRRRRA